jgi:hypothetical protein
VCPDCGLAVRIGIGSDPRLVHDSCSEKKGEQVFLVNHNGLKHTIYESTSDEEMPQIIHDLDKISKALIPVPSKILQLKKLPREQELQKTSSKNWYGRGYLRQCHDVDAPSTRNNGPAL